VEWWCAEGGVKDERRWMKITEAAIYMALRMRMGCVLVIIHGVVVIMLCSHSGPLASVWKANFGGCC
jgi:hypothetical protein